MPTPPSPLKDHIIALLALQEVDSHIQRVRKSLALQDDGSKLKAASELSAKMHATALSALHVVHGDLKDSELKLATLETKIKSYEQKLYQGTVTNPKELANIEKEINALGHQRSDLDGKVLGLMDESDTQEAVVRALAATAERDKAAFEEHRAAYVDRKDSLGRELAAVTAKRPDVVKAVTDAALLKRYEELRPRHDGLAITHIVEGYCGGCRTRLPSMFVTLVKQGDEVQYCENCGRILVV